MKKCTYFPACTGCQLWNIPYEKQISEKIENLTDHLKKSTLYDENSFKINFKSLGENSLRHRFDFTITNNKFGLYDQDRKILDLEKCLQLSPELQEIYNEFRNFKFPVCKGSARLRVSPEGTKGLWLDFANQDIKNLLDEKKLLTDILNAGYIIEFGQKNKRIFLNNTLQIPKVGEPKSLPWFQTYSESGKSLKMQGFLSSFTQPSWITAREIVRIIFDWLDNYNIKNKEHLKIAEFGSGLGQYTLPLLSQGHCIDAYEWDISACNNLKLSCEVNALNIENLKIFNDDFHFKSIEEKQYDLVLVNPARSGLKDFVDQIKKTQTKYIVYISCFPDSLSLDLHRLRTSTYNEENMTYQIKAVTIIDQFPQTKHYEACVLLERF